MKPASGAGADERLVPSPGEKIPSDWSADGRFLLYSSLDPQTARDLWVLPLDGDRTPWVFVKTPFSESSGTFSPDGRWVAYTSNESGREEIYIRPFAGPAASGAAAPPSGGQWRSCPRGSSAPARAGNTTWPAMGASSSTRCWTRRPRRSHC